MYSIYEETLKSTFKYICQVILRQEIVTMLVMDTFVFKIWILKFDAILRVGPDSRTLGKDSW